MDVTASTVLVTVAAVEKTVTMDVKVLFMISNVGGHTLTLWTYAFMTGVVVTVCTSVNVPLPRVMVVVAVINGVGAFKHPQALEIVSSSQFERYAGMEKFALPVVMLPGKLAMEVPLSNRLNFLALTVVVLAVGEVASWSSDGSMMTKVVNGVAVVKQL